MHNQKGIVNKTILVIIASIIILLVGVAWWYESNNGESNVNNPKIETSEIKNGSVSITCSVDTDCIIVDKEKDYSKCCISEPPDCENIYQEGSNFIAVNKDSYTQLVQTEVENKENRCTGTSCDQYAMITCPDGDSSKYIGSCINNICKKASKN